jgi:hypothetical protein
MKKINKYNLTKIKSGQEFKDLRALCHFLEIDYNKYKQKNTRKGLFRALGLISNFKKDGHKIIIQEVFNSNVSAFLKKIKEYKYYDELYYQMVIKLLYFLYECNEICMSMSELLLKLNIYNSKFTKDFFKKRKKLIKKFNNKSISNIKSKDTINRFMFPVYSKNASKLEGILQNLSEDNIINIEKNKYILVNNSKLESVKLNDDQSLFYTNYKTKYLDKNNSNNFSLFHPNSSKKFKESFSQAFEKKYGSKVINIYNKYEIKLLKNISEDILNKIEEERNQGMINILSQKKVEEMCKDINSIPQEEAEKLIQYYIKVL